jgi:hypothetical protein
MWRGREVGYCECGLIDWSIEVYGMLCLLSLALNSDPDSDYRRMSEKVHVGG